MAPGFVIFYTPFARLFGFESFEARHGGYMFDLGIYFVIWIVVETLYLTLFRRKQTAMELAETREAIASGRIKRMPLAARWLFLSFFLALVLLGSLGSGPYRMGILTLSVPLFLLFCAVEFACIVHPGEALLPNPSDELLTFFKAKMLQAGYVTAIGALAILYLSYLAAPKYVGLLLPLALAACLLIPSLVYKRLDRQAAGSG